MDIKELISRINFLYKKSQEEGLTEEEKIEQKKLREIYVQRVKNNFRAQMDTIRPVDKGKSKYKN
jgi:uncharacterized protein YnzC (UPF0291/DUF896 family)